jgi:hypothetical protein
LPSCEKDFLFSDVLSAKGCEQGWFKIVREPQFPLNAIKAEASLSAKFLRFFAEDSLALEALVDSLALKMRIRIRWG